MAQIERLQFITNGTTRQEILRQVTSFLEGGGKWVQLRMKKSSDSEFIAMARELKPLCSAAGAILLINDRADIASEVDCDGVHIGKEDISVAEARAIIGEGKIIGRTCNSVQDVAEAMETGADYLGVGPLRFTTTKERLSPVIGFDGYKAILEKTKCPLPIIAVGGIIEDDIPQLLECGVYGIAVSGVIASSQNPAETTQQMVLSLKAKN